MCRREAWPTGRPLTERIRIGTIGVGPISGQPRSLQLSLDGAELVRLDVEQHQVRPGRAAGQPELAQQVVLHQIQRSEQEGSEADRKHERYGLIGWPVQVGQSLPPDVGPSLPGSQRRITWTRAHDAAHSSSNAAPTAPAKMVPCRQLPT